MAKKVKRSSSVKMPVNIENDEQPISLNMILAVVAILILAGLAVYMVFGGGSVGAPVTGGQQPPAEIAQQVSELQKRIQANPNDVGALLDLGAIYLNSQQLDQAAGLFGRVLVIDPKNAEALDYLGNIDFIQGRYDEALMKYDSALAIDPLAPYALYDKAYLLQFTKKDYAAAIPVWEKFIEVLATGPDVDRAKGFVAEAQKALANPPAADTTSTSTSQPSGQPSGSSGSATTSTSLPASTTSTSLSSSTTSTSLTTSTSNDDDGGSGKSGSGKDDD